jgi:hypothetical protein
MCAMPGGSKDLKADSSTVVWGYFYQVGSGGRGSVSCIGGVTAAAECWAGMETEGPAAWHAT